MDRAHVPVLLEGELLSVTRRVRGMGPRAFLTCGEGHARGFWARGHRWVAHIGVLQETSVFPGDAAEKRFHAVGEALEGVRTRLSGEKARLYGGFSFRVDDQLDPVWNAFPPARFILPEAELEGGRSDATAEELLLRVWVAPREGEGPAEARARAERRLDELARAVESGGERRSGGPRAPEGVSLRTETDRAAWEAGVEGVLEAIAQGTVEKVVLARTLDVTPPFQVDPLEILDQLRWANPMSHVFLFEPDPGACLLGAAPETISTLRKGRFEATAVAGSVPRGETPEEQSFLARQLLGSRKDRAEHRYTVEEMVRRLAGRADDVEAEEEPHVLTLSRIQHLETRVTAHPRPGETVLSLLEELHPTPAVCGLPRDAALVFLREVEPFQRGWYAGPVGWADTEGDGVFVPALRTAVSSDGVWRLFAGAGIVDGSDPGLEWEETRIKFQPVLQALAASGAP